MVAQYLTAAIAYLGVTFCALSFGAIKWHLKWESPVQKSLNFG